MVQRTGLDGFVAERCHRPKEERPELLALECVPLDARCTTATPRAICILTIRRNRRVNECASRGIITQGGAI